MSEKGKHTQGKWKVDISYPHKYILNDKDAIIIDSEHKNTEEGKANLKYIVKAVNNHDELLEALKELRKQISAHHKMEIKRDFSLILADAQAFKAINKAEGKG